MLNLNDVRVEQERAQVRYQEIVLARRRLDSGKALVYVRLLHTFGQGLVKWGDYLKCRFPIVAEEI